MVVRQRTGMAVAALLYCAAISSLGSVGVEGFARQKHHSANKVRPCPPPLAEGCWHLQDGATSSSSTRLSAVLKQPNQPSPRALSYPEQSRVYRRDFFTHDSWLQHRSKYRFVATLRDMPKSGVVRALLEELLLVGAIATFVVLFNALLVEGWDDWNLVHHAPLTARTGTSVPLIWLPVEGFTLSSSALSLLLVFKTNTSFKRWDEARKAWGVIVNNSRTVIRQASAWIHQSSLPLHEKRHSVQRVANAVWLYPRSLQRHLLSAAEDEAAYVHDVRQRLPPPLADQLVQARHRPTRALFEMSCALAALPLDAFQRTTVDAAVTQLSEACAACERLFSSPVPTFYTRHAARLVELYMLFVPAALYKPFASTWNHWAMIPASLLLGFFFLGIEELAIQLEEPFSVLPLAQIAKGIGLSADEHVEWMEATFQDQQHQSTGQPWRSL